MNPPPDNPSILPGVLGAAGICQRKVGFLFPRVCGRISPQGCIHCNEGSMDADEDPYYVSQEEWYSDFHDYSSWDLAGFSPSAADAVDYDRSVDFTEADSESLIDDMSDDPSLFESDPGES